MWFPRSYQTTAMDSISSDKEAEAKSKIETFYRRARANIRRYTRFAISWVDWCCVIILEKLFYFIKGIIFLIFWYWLSWRQDRQEHLYVTASSDQKSLIWRFNQMSLAINLPHKRAQILVYFLLLPHFHSNHSLVWKITLEECPKMLHDFNNVSSVLKLTGPWQNVSPWQIVIFESLLN